MPFALIMTIVIVTIVMTAVQVVAVGTLPGLAASKTPLTDASLLFLGGAGAALLTLGAVLSTTGNNMGQALSGSRNLFALAGAGRPAGDVRSEPICSSARPSTPTATTSARVFLALAVSGRDSDLALVSAISRLLVYVATCASTLLILRSTVFAGRVKLLTFVVPFGAVIPAAAIAIALAMLAGARREQLIAGLISLVVGGFLYLIAIRRSSVAEPL